ncbi:hypothetical protein ACFP9V_22755 [Deinococcus radiopugnans]|uniref:hypothetical protein n=1 Tax=Deinococcus radiopugnans TaxID=57497 RepID=UPI00362380C0
MISASTSVAAPANEPTQNSAIKASRVFTARPLRNRAAPRLEHRRGIGIRASDVLAVLDGGVHVFLRQRLHLAVELLFLGHHLLLALVALHQEVGVGHHLLLHHLAELVEQRHAHGGVLLELFRAQPHLNFSHLTGAQGCSGVARQAVGHTRPHPRNPNHTRGIGQRARRVRFQRSGGFVLGLLGLEGLLQAVCRVHRVLQPGQAVAKRQIGIAVDRGGRDAAGRVLGKGRVDVLPGLHDVVHRAVHSAAEPSVVALQGLVQLLRIGVELPHPQILAELAEKFARVLAHHVPGKALPVTIDDVIADKGVHGPELTHPFQGFTGVDGDAGHATRRTRLLEQPSQVIPPGRLGRGRRRQQQGQTQRPGPHRPAP